MGRESVRACALVLLFAGFSAAGQAVGSPMADSLGPGAGVMVAGELWDSFLPPSAGAAYQEWDAPLTSTFLRIGNFERAWRTPTHMWPGGWPYGMFWAKGMYLTEFNPDTSWNPATLGGKWNPARHSGAGPRYAFASYTDTLLGAADPARNYARETRWTDPLRRTHALYEAGWPTNIGIDVRIAIHQWTVNWNNFNDFILVEIVLSNTGVLDMNADGVPDSLQGGRRALNRIRALALMAHGGIFGSYTLGRNGGRGSRLGAARGFGYVGDADPAGEPWEMMVAFPGESSPPLRDMGLNSYPEGFYTDVWSAWSWIGVKSGEAPGGSVHLLPEKPTLYGTHPIGTGAERGWYTTAGHGRNLGVSGGGYWHNPRLIHTTSMGTWYMDGGKSRDSARLDLRPDPDFFASGIEGDPTSFVRAAAPSRPRGDRKLIGEWDVNPYEGGWTKGFSGVDNFDGDMYSGVGPFSLEPGESMTIVWAEAGGYRLDGVKNAIAAARWAFDHGYAIPEPPPAPEMKVENTLQGTMRVVWDGRAESFPGFAGYRIYRTSTARKVEWLKGGMRLMDNSWRSPSPGPVPDSLMQPVNPAFVAGQLTDGKWSRPDSWGPYELVAAFPKSSLPGGTAPWAHAWDDTEADPGFSYWYYVAAEASGTWDLESSYAGSNPRSTARLESGNFSRNGAAGLWQGAYPWADLSASFPTTPEGKKAIGAGIQFASAVADPGQITSGTVRVGVRPNPLKRIPLRDAAAVPPQSHIEFYNLPPQATITIIDVSGQVIDRLEFTSPDGETGSMMWDLRSKDGVEVASGLYLFVVEFAGGQQTGYFSILR